MKLKKYVNVVDTLYDFFGQSTLSQVGFFTIPHHGSKDNWNPEFISIINNCVGVVSTYSYYDNRMTTSMEADLRRKGIRSFIVDENIDTEIEQHIEPSKHAIISKLGGVKVELVL